MHWNFCIAVAAVCRRQLFPPVQVGRVISKDSLGILPFGTKISKKIFEVFFEDRHWVELGLRV